MKMFPGNTISILQAQIFVRALEYFIELAITIAIRDMQQV